MEKAVTTVNFSLFLVAKTKIGHFSTTIGWVKSVRIRSFSGPYFPAFRLITER